MSLSGQTRSLGDVRSMSGLLPRADLRASSNQVSEVLEGDLRALAMTMQRVSPGYRCRRGRPAVSVQQAIHPCRCPV
jgi:hypothetical protein